MMDPEDRKAYQRIDEIVGYDCKQLSLCKNLHKSLNKERNEVEFKLRTIRNDVPLKVKQALSEIDELCSNVASFNKEIETFLEVYDDGEVGNAFEKLSIYADLKREYTKKLHYYKTLKFIETSNCEIKKNYLEKDWRRCLPIYLGLCSLFHFIFNTECENIRNYLKDVLEYWHTLLKIELIAEYEQLIKAMNWPFVIRNKDLLSYPTEDMKDKFKQLTKLLLEVELPEKMHVKPIITSSLVADFPTPSLPVTLLLEPFRKRFVYHFCGSRQTNRPDKPEWMFSQVLTWIRDHELFLVEWMQPVYEGFSNSVKVQFVSNLVKILTEKLYSDFIQFQSNDTIFTHMLDETLSFHRELTKNIRYPASCPSVLSVLTQAQIFVKWINVEKKYAEKRVDDIINSNTAWTIINEDEKCRLTECGDKFIILLSSITDRYSSLPQPGHRLQFLDFQLDLIDDFRLRLAQLKRDDYSDVLCSDLPAILNTVHYINSVLMEWGSDMNFLILHHFKNQASIEEDAENSTVFSDVLAVLNHFSDELINEICNSVMLEISAKSRSYRKDRWNLLPPMDPEAELSLTFSGCTMFQVLCTKLHQMRKIIAPEVFTVCWKYIAEQLCKLFIDDVILVNMFSKGGAQQIRFDVIRNILPLFAEFTRKPEAYFKPLIEACDLLCLDYNTDVTSLPINISNLNPDQVEAILNRKSGRMLMAACG